MPPAYIYTLDIELPFLTKPTNRQTSMHWAAKSKMVKEIKEEVWAMVGSHKPREPLKRATLSCGRLSSVCPDYDGLVSSWKHVIDALVECGVLEDDDMKHIGMPHFFWRKCKPKEGRMILCVSGFNVDG